MGGTDGDSIIIIIGGDHMDTIMEIDMVVVILDTDLDIDLQIITVRVSHAQNTITLIAIELRAQILGKILGPLNYLQGYHALAILIIVVGHLEPQQEAQAPDHQTLVREDLAHVRVPLLVEEVLGHQRAKVNLAIQLVHLQGRIMYIPIEMGMYIAKIVQVHGKTEVIIVGHLHSLAIAI